jgi:hypothetical protein
MESEALRLLIRAKLADGRLPSDRLPRVWGGPGNGELCAACGERVTKDHSVLEGSALDGRPFQLHARCFNIWDSERQAPETKSV